jgi:type I restriction enzyme S subunit
MRQSSRPYIGPIPCAWKDVQLKHVLRAAVTDGPHETPIFVDEGYPFLSVDGIQEGKLVFEGCRYVSEANFLEFRRKASPSVGDLLMGKAASTGKIARVTTDLEFAIWSPLALLRLDTHLVDSRFVEYVLKTPALQQQIDDLCNANTQKNIGMGDIPKLAFGLPLLQEQERIANFLDDKTARIDALIAEKERLLEKLKDYAYSFASQAMTRGLNPNAVLKETGSPEVGRIPSHWKLERLKFLGEVCSGVAKGKELNGADTISLPYLRVANVQDGYLDLDNVQEIEVALSDATRYLLQPGDVLMNEGGDNDKLGRGAVWQGQISPCIHQNHVFAVRLTDPTQSEWVARFTSTDAARAYFFLRSKQSTNLASINQSNVRELPVPMPPEEERKEVLAEVKRVTGNAEGLITHAKTHIARLREYRSSLISAAVTGQLDINQ